MTRSFNARSAPTAFQRLLGDSPKRFDQLPAGVKLLLRLRKLLPQSIASRWAFRFSRIG